MKWKNLGFALLVLVLQSSYLRGADNPAPTAQAPAWRATQGSELLPNSGLNLDDVRGLPLCEEPSRQAVEGSELFPQRLPWPSWEPSCSPVQFTQPEPLPRVSWEPSSSRAQFTQPEPLEEINFRLLDESGDSAGDAPFVTPCVPYRRDFAARFGWWFVEADGSPTKVAEYQGLGSSPFLDVDGLFSDGQRTVNLFGTELDNETSQAGLQYFGPGLAADFNLQRYLHRLDHDPLSNMGDMQSGEEIIREDLNVGEDYALRVEDVRTSFEGRLTEHIKARLNFRSLRKHGERQANAMQHCYSESQQNNPQSCPQNSCHVLSQRQEIDWLTVKIEPVIEAKYGPIRAEYSRPMRILNQDDQVVMSDFGLHYPTERDYAFVPENVTQIDRLKLSVDLAAQTDFYARLSAGDTKNEFRDTHRKFQVCDLRLTNRTWDGLTLTGYLTMNKQTNEYPPFLLPEEQAALSVPNAWVPPYGIQHPVDYSLTTAGAEAAWQPFQTGDFAKGLSLTAGGEQGALDREFAEYYIQDPQIVVDQGHTPITEGHVGAAMKFSPRLNTYVRYKYRSVQDPLFGVNRYEGTTNSNLPEHDQLVEIGGMWHPLTNLTANATVGMGNRSHQSEIANFDESSYPMTFTLWYAPTPVWSLSAGYGFYSNWIEQDILFPSDDPQAETWNRSRWDYGGRFRVLSVGAAYAWTPRITLSGGLQLVSANDAFDPLVLWPDLSNYSEVSVDTSRVTAGVDWQLHDRISAYFRYRFEEYMDRSADYNSGTAHMSLLGLSAVY